MRAAARAYQNFKALGWNVLGSLGRLEPGQ